MFKPTMTFFLSLQLYEKVLSPDEQALIEEWASWHETLKKLKHSIANGARVLNLIEEFLFSARLSLPRLTLEE